MNRLLSPLQLPYALGVHAKNALYERQLFQARHLAWPVISIGNLSTGGSGKTPFTLELARLLQAQGVPVDVLSRGYGRRSPVAVERVASGDAARYGDEPVLLAQAGVPVYVGASRYRAGLLAERDAASIPAPTCLHLLDDGFQHRALARDVDIVLLHPRDAGDTLLPSGRLREPHSALRRADFVVLREEDTRSAALLSRLNLRAPAWRVRRSLRVPPIAGPAVAFAAIAHPQEFFAQLRAAGVPLRDAFAFRDHHRFRREEILRIRAAADDACAILTTEKDNARLPEAAARLLREAAPLLPVPLETELLDAPLCLDALFATLAAGSRVRK